MPSKFNISLSERKAIECLKQNSNLIIKEADKGSAVVVMEKEFYINQTKKIIDDTSAYQEVDADADYKLMKTLNQFITKYKSELTEGEIKFLSNFEFKTSNLYCLPKIHKSTTIIEKIMTEQSEVISVNDPPDLEMRPIIAGPMCPTHRLSHLLDILLRPLVEEVRANVRDTRDMLARLPERLEENHSLATFDVKNLYGNITHQTGLDAVGAWLREFPRETSRISNAFILDGLRLILENNNFFFNGKFFKQLKGTAMGTKVAPVYATLTLGYLEQSLYHTNVAPLNRMFKTNYFRYLDDILLIFDKNLIDMNSISAILNNLHPDLVFKLETCGSMVDFLDLKIITDNGYLSTDIFYKTTDSKQYLNFRSHHPRHTKRALPYNLSRRICTIVSDSNLRTIRLNEMKSSLIKCNYPKALIQDGINKALAIDRKDLIHPTENAGTDNNSIPFVSTFNSNYHDNSTLVKDYFRRLKNSKSTKNIFESKNLIIAKRHHLT